jgi:hypothetical protein
MRPARILALLITLNVLLGVLAAAVVLSPEYAALDAAVRKGAALPAPSPQVAREVTSRPEWKREIVQRPRCGTVCRARIAIILHFYDENELLRAYVATR